GANPGAAAPAARFEAPAELTGRPLSIFMARNVGCACLRLINALINDRANDAGIERLINRTGRVSAQ
ncbi:MAG TPA: hypothetical protein PLN53_06895, partial [Terricaulis sp.]|nr:hypothetical protein [Terricaulis sp.]